MRALLWTQKNGKIYFNLVNLFINILLFKACLKSLLLPELQSIFFAQVFFSQTQTLTLSLSLSLSHTHTHTHSPFSLSLSLTHIHSLSLAHTHNGIRVKKNRARDVSKECSNSLCHSKRVGEKKQLKIDKASPRRYFI